MTTKTKVTIYVDRNGNTNNLYLRDSEGHEGVNTITTDVSCDDDVEWIVGNGIDEITNIVAKSGSQNIFSSGPTKRADGNWEGTVCQHASGSESYSIEYKIDGQTMTDDPKFRVKPPEN
ncbi:hypothetical protein PZB74_09235 [Porifericola rhodea]|uniref:hypothetical protein n=1 Tax=Porifericola rhodea TaxID=930972 RepID=UPI002665A164|nr:hypothetical protein [Porifericola rhodea]WKN33512.1 hypothetical protein PZB74_09235 [Porifericola rhodea]